MIKEEIIFSKQDCEFILDCAKDFSRSLVYSAAYPEGRYNHTRTSDQSKIKIGGKLKEFLLNKLEVLGVKNLPETIKILRYGKDQQFKRHRDNSSTYNAAYYRTLSIQLNDYYDGGDLKIWDENDEEYTVSKELGNTVLFSSDYLHQACPVTSGIRYSAVLLLSAYNMGKSKSLL